MGTFFTGVFVLAIICLAVRKLYKDRKNGNACGCDCGGCTQCPGRAPVDIP